LPKYQDYDYQIELKLGIKSIFQLLKKYLTSDLITIKQYINKNLAKGFIQEFKSPWENNVLFIEKKDSK